MLKTTYSTTLIIRCLFLALITTNISSCKKKENTKEEDAKATFDKQALLVNMADNVILPNYLRFKQSVDSLTTVYNAFKTSGSQSDFSNVKQQFHATYLKYQHIDLYEFGPAETEIVRMNFNVFPTDSLQIKSNILSANYNLSSASNLDAKGFPALDYLFFGKGKTEASILAEFNASTNQKNYVSDVLLDMSSKLNTIINTWNSSYRNTFVNSLSTDIGSSIGFLVNQLNYQLDYLKNSKIGVPLGKKTLGIILPEKCEGYYSGYSLSYINETLTSIENTYLGKTVNGTNEKGFDDYLDHLEAAYNGGSLNAAIINQFALAKSKLALLSNPFSGDLINNPNAVDAAYVELVKLLVLLKTDLPSNLGVVITYQDGDGD